MELGNYFVVYVGLVVAIVVFLILLIRFDKKKEFKGGKKVAANSYIEDEAYFKRRLALYKGLSFLIYVCLIGSVAVSLFMMTAPYKEKKITNEKYSRDIVLCLDASGSMDEVNTYLVSSLKNVVKELENERFGIVVFNTSPVVLSPLCDDYDYTVEILENIEKSYSIREDISNIWSFEDLDKLGEDWYYWLEYIEAGTGIDAEIRGSSLIGDGLASSIYSFDELSTDRTKIVIFATDNDLQGTPYITLQDAATHCKKNNIIVYGVGTDLMDGVTRNDMKSAVEKTGGKFYTAEDKSSVKKIVSDIEKESKSLIKGGEEIQRIDIVVRPFILLLISMTGMFVTFKITRR